jgi:hypothetical protein
VELGGALGREDGEGWGRAVIFTADVKNAFVGGALEDLGLPPAFIAGGALDTLRGDARTVGVEISGRLPLPLGFYVRGRGLILRDRDGADAALWVGPQESAVAALGLGRRFFRGDLLANAELIGHFRGVVPTPFAELDAATIVSFRVTGDVERRFDLFYEVDNLLNEVADSRTFVSDIGPIFLPGRNYSFGVIWRLLD